MDEDNFSPRIGSPTLFDYELNYSSRKNTSDSYYETPAKLDAEDRENNSLSFMLELDLVKNCLDFDREYECNGFYDCFDNDRL